MDEAKPVIVVTYKLAHYDGENIEAKFFHALFDGEIPYVASTGYEVYHLTQIDVPSDH
ncbi:MAG: hypothetical protein LBC35_05165 [Coriobacteriales bacterium]|nr:hypothetical protein [Coriobacteriales bacterium]